MHGGFALAVALAGYGNAYLASAADSSAPELYGTNSTLQYVQRLSFVSPGSGTLGGKERGGAVAVAGRTSPWFAELRRNHAARIWVVKLDYGGEIPEMVAVAFAGGIPWALSVEYPGQSELWYPAWTAHGGKNPWRVRVQGTRTDYLVRPGIRRPNEVVDSFRSTLERASSFSSDPDLDWFRSMFSKALGLLVSPRPEIPYHPDMLPPTGYSVQARQLAAAGAAAWVFGGMGSFNDLGFDDPARRLEYERLASDLYHEVVEALLCAVNSFDAAVP